MTVVVTLAGVALVGLGAWAFFDPASFFAQLAVFPPYNQHFLHDVGAFQVGLGATLLLALIWSDALLVALSGVGIAATIHFVSHVIDRNLGGRPASDLPLLGLLALALLVSAGLRYRQVRGSS